MDQLTIKSYDADAAGFCEQYESAETADLHGLLRRYVTAGDRVLDVGCGSGRDALFMKNLGGAVTAVDGSAAMLQEAEKRHPELAGHLHHAALPLTSNHELLHEKFDVFACLAFLMHVPDEDLFELAFQVKQLLNTDGLLIVSVSTQRPGLSDDRDNRGRLFRERAPGEIQLLFERLGFRLLEHRTSGDGMGREIVWSHLVFNLADETGKGPVDQIETVINRDKKDATYKLALLRALCDIAQTEYRQAQWSVDDTVSVPLGLIAEKWLFYYWPLIEPDLDHQTVVIPQKRGLEINKPIAFRAPVLALVAHCCKHGGMDTFFHEYRHGTLEGKTAALADEALNRISNTIITGPVQYAGGALDGSDRFFWRSGGITRRRKCVSSRGTIEALGRVHMRGDIWRELSLLGHWIGEALILRWAELTHEISKHTVPVSKTIERLLIYPDNERDQDRVKSFYRELPSLNCVWTNQPLKNKFDVDHLIPFSLWHNNDFWNLLPTDPRVNNQKRDKLVGRQTLMNQRHTIMGYWELMRESFEDQFDNELNRSLTGGKKLKDNWQNEAFASLTAAVETVALQRGIERWEPVKSGWQISKRRTKPAEAANEKVISFAEIAETERDEYLPLVGELAAGEAYNGFLTDRLENTQGLQWVRVPQRFRGKGRFVIRIAGDSMAPALSKGDLVVFEYHRRPREQNQVVIAAVAEFGAASDGDAVETVKRLQETQGCWQFTADNPVFRGFVVPKSDTDYPILGTMVGKLEP